MKCRKPLRSGRAATRLPAIALAALLGGSTAAAGQEAMPVGVAMYYECDMTREARADEIMLEELAPVFQQYVDSGDLLSWVWLEHDLGGRWRRASAFYAPDHETLFRVRIAILEDLERSKPEATAEFTDICHTHEDYVWIQRFRSP